MVRRRRWHRALAPKDLSSETSSCVLQIRGSSKQVVSITLRKVLQTSIYG